MQLHGDEPPEDVEAVDLPAIKAIRGADAGGGARAYPGSILLLDHPTQGGGHGQGLGLARGRPLIAQRLRRDHRRRPHARERRRGARRRRRVRRGASTSRRASRAPGTQGSGTHARVRRGRRRAAAKRSRGRAGRVSELKRDPMRGHFGPFGGRYVPETLVRPLDELDRGLGADPARDPAFGGARRTAARTTSAARRRSTSRRALTRGARRRAHLPEARGPRPHRRPQDQQRARPGAARAAHGQAARHRRDRRGPARRRDGDRVRAARPRRARSTWARRTCGARR